MFNAGGGLDKIVVLMEGESLFNDATSIVLFEIFFEMVKKIGDGDPGTEGTLVQEGIHILGQIVWLTAGMHAPCGLQCLLCMSRIMTMAASIRAAFKIWQTLAHKAHGGGGGGGGGKQSPK